MTTDFEERAIETMLQAGISMAHIQAQKRTFFQTLPVDNYYNEIENSEEPNLEIPVNKILAMQTTWPVEGKSVYDLFMGKTNDGKDEAAFKAHLVSLKKYGLDCQITSYAGKQNLDGDRPICFNYYKEDDCYILQKNGAHRTIAAKMFNAPVISGIVTTYEQDEKKKKLYEDYESLKEILRLTDLKGMTLDFFEEKKKSQKKNS